jgi:hypothetical protein
VNRQAPVDSTQYTSPASASVVQMPDTCSTWQRVKQEEEQLTSTCQLHGRKTSPAPCHCC